MKSEQDQIHDAGRTIANFIAMAERKAKKKYVWALVETKLPDGEMVTKADPVREWKKGEPRIIPVADNKGKPS